MALLSGYDPKHGINIVNVKKHGITFMIMTKTWYYYGKSKKKNLKPLENMYKKQ